FRIVQQIQRGASDAIRCCGVLDKLRINRLVREQVRHREVFDTDGHPAGEVRGPGSFVEDHCWDAEVSAFQSDGAGFRDRQIGCPTNSTRNCGTRAAYQSLSNGRMLSNESTSRAS